MGTVLSHRLNFLSVFQRRSKTRIKHAHQTSEEESTENNTDQLSVNDNNTPMSNINLVGELVPERYLVLLTEQMTEMLFRLMTCNDTFILLAEGGSDYRTPLGKNIDSVSITSPITTPNSNHIRSQSPLQTQSVHQPCIQCNMKMLTIEEFHELHNAFRQVDNDRDNFLTRDEIRMTLNYLFELTEYDIKEIISVFDINKDDRISFEEYIEEMKHRLLHEFTREEIKIAFDQADIKQNGHLRIDELKNAIGYLNLHLPNRRIVEIVNDCTNNETIDTIDFILFTNIVKSLHRREPITLQKFKPTHHLTSIPTTS
ncbi:unnamed protein product [Adineta steineri]|uniref:EF-hand domain-containing protein n=2 Tax=Adineta steineri TaxID=433720 RepID=A0A813XC98_9BILA|nr:unnamed protein product [Adineta steineri]CAF0919462.1 unnamed protein product [Adineta steineri]CAF3576341.1 unnamed protein product [Adineta steineri]CAF3714718.1 unnamed protein product [Adineta steineri]